VNKPIRTTTPGGEEIVILPAAKYDRLLALAEDTRDIALAERALAELAAGKGELLNEFEMRELLRASTPMAFWRNRQKLTQAVLARAGGISQAYLAQIEKGKRVGDVRLYRRLASVLRVEIEDLLPPEQKPATTKRKPAAKRRKWPRPRSA
jgi:DNA-binding XRE family transcriptional regulator